MSEKMSVKEWISEVNAGRSEKSISDQIRSYLAARRIYCTRQNSGKIGKAYTTKAGQVKQHFIQLHDPGTPDLLAIYKGRAIQIETKIKGGKPTPIQLAEQQRIEVQGGAPTINADRFEVFEAQWLELTRLIDTKAAIFKK